MTESEHAALVERIQGDLPTLTRGNLRRIARKLEYDSWTDIFAAIANADGGAGDFETVKVLEGFVVHGLHEVLRRGGATVPLEAIDLVLDDLTIKEMAELVGRLLGRDPKAEGTADGNAENAN